jgi:hypothetical protein
MEAIMKRTALQIWLAIGLTIGLTVSAQAQISTEYRASIPFDFSVGKTTFKAGDYIIGLINPKSNQQTLAIRDAKGRGGKFFMILPKETNAGRKAAKLVFNRYENQCFLSEMTTPTLGAEFLKSKSEVRLAQNQKSNQETIGILK